MSAWEVGRNQAQKDEELVLRVINGALPVSVFKGGFKKKLDTITFKYGLNEKAEAVVKMF